MNHRPWVKKESSCQQHSLILDTLPFKTQKLFVCSFKVYINGIAVVCANHHVSYYQTRRDNYNHMLKNDFSSIFAFKPFEFCNLQLQYSIKSKEKCTTIFLALIPYACNSITMCEIVYFCAFIFLLLNCKFREHYHKCCMFLHIWYRLTQTVCKFASNIFIMCNKSHREKYQIHPVKIEISKSQSHIDLIRFCVKRFEK